MKKDKLIKYVHLNEKYMREHEIEVFERIFTDDFKSFCIDTTYLCGHTFDEKTHAKIILEMNDVLMKYCKNKEGMVNATLLVYFYWKSLVLSVNVLDTSQRLREHGNEAIRP